MGTGETFVLEYGQRRRSFRWLWRAIAMLVIAIGLILALKQA